MCMGLPCQMIEDYQFIFNVYSSCTEEKHIKIANRLVYLYFNKYWKFRNVCGLKQILKSQMEEMFGSCHEYYWVIYKRRKLENKPPLQKGKNNVVTEYL